MINRRQKSWASISVISFNTVVLTRWHGAFSSKSHKQDQDLIFWHGRVHLAGYWQAVNQEKKSHIRSLLIEWHLSNRPCGGRNIKQFRVLRAFTWCTGHRWRKIKDLFVFCSSVKFVWLSVLHGFCSFVLRHLCPVSRSIKMPYFGYNTPLAESLWSFLPLPDLFTKIKGDSVRKVRLQMLLSKSAFCSFSVLAIHLPERSVFFFLIFLIKK